MHLQLHCTKISQRLHFKVLHHLLPFGSNLKCEKVQNADALYPQSTPATVRQINKSEENDATNDMHCFIGSMWGQNCPSFTKSVFCPPIGGLAALYNANFSILHNLIRRMSTTAKSNVNSITLHEAPFLKPQTTVDFVTLKLLLKGQIRSKVMTYLETMGPVSYWSKKGSPTT